MSTGHAAGCASGTTRWTRQPAGVDACAWVSQAAGTEAALLVRAGSFTERQPAGPWRGDRLAPVNFPDAYPLLVCSQASLDDLNGRLPAPLPMTRFRPNVVVEGLPPYAEDDIEELRFGEVRLRLVKACTRCSTTTIDQESGETSGDPLVALRRYRFDRALRGVTFGQNALVIAGLGAALGAGERGIAVHRRAT
jgi:uncharacterized protein YcbX